MAKRLALIALLALATHAFLPYLHALASGCGSHGASCSSESQAPASHSSDCAVCGAIAQAGARAIDAPAALAALVESRSVFAPAPESLAAVPKVERDVACARAPPVSLRSV